MGEDRCPGTMTQNELELGLIGILNVKVTHRRTLQRVVHDADQVILLIGNAGLGMALGLPYHGFLLGVFATNYFVKPYLSWPFYLWKRQVLEDALDLNLSILKMIILYL